MRPPEKVIADALYVEGFVGCPEAASVAVGALREAGYVLVTRPVYSEKPDSVDPWGRKDCTRHAGEMLVGDKVLRFSQLIRTHHARELPVRQYLANELGRAVIGELSPGG